MSIRIDVNWYKILGLPEPTKNPTLDPTLGDVQPYSPSKQKWILAWEWVRENRLFVVSVGILLVIVLFATKKRRG